MDNSASGKDWQHRPPYQTPETPREDGGCFEKKLQGGCHCGRVKYWLSREAPLKAKYCHCTDCQVIHGAPFQWAAIFHKTDVAFEDGVQNLKFYNSGSGHVEHGLPCKASCAYCGTHVMDEGRNMVLLFPTLVRFGSRDVMKGFEASCHLFYTRRVMDIPDGKPKWTGLDEKSELMDDA